VIGQTTFTHTVMMVRITMFPFTQKSYSVSK